MKVDKYGKCPCCEDDWNGGDILEGVGNLDVLIHANVKDKIALAQQYGWSEEKPTRFSRVITYEKNGRVLYQCPAIRCGKVFDANTGEQFNGMESVWISMQPPAPTIAESNEIYKKLFPVVDESIGVPLSALTEEDREAIKNMFDSSIPVLAEVDEQDKQAIVYGTPGELTPENTEEFYQPSVNTVPNKRIESFSNRLKSFKKK